MLCRAAQTGAKFEKKKVAQNPPYTPPLTPKHLSLPDTNMNTYTSMVRVEYYYNIRGGGGESGGGNVAQVKRKGSTFPDFANRFGSS